MTVRKQLRIAVAMNGGVSLAVWISGVAHELVRLERASSNYSGWHKQSEDHDPTHKSTYKDALDKADYDVQLDVLAGSSAGGINAGLVWHALKSGLPDLAFAREVWLGSADLNQLLQEPLDRSAPSLLKGDYFLTKLASALKTTAGHGVKELRQGLPNATYSAALTVSVLDGIETLTTDSSGSALFDTDHRATLNFSFTSPEGTVETGSDRAEDAEALALASRATAAFPAAFEPVRLPLKDSGSTVQPNMRRYLNPEPPTNRD